MHSDVFCGESQDVTQHREAEFYVAGCLHDYDVIVTSFICCCRPLPSLLEIVMAPLSAPKSVFTDCLSSIVCPHSRRIPHTISAGRSAFHALTVQSKSTVFFAPSRLQKYSLNIRQNLVPPLVQRGARTIFIQTENTPNTDVSMQLRKYRSYVLTQ